MAERGPYPLGYGPLAIWIGWNVSGGASTGTQSSKARRSCLGQYDIFPVANSAAVGVLYDGSDKVVQ